MKHAPSILGAIFLALCSDTLRCEVLYETDFESHSVGDNFWSRTDGWWSNDHTSGAQGIVEDFVPELPLGKVGYLGFEKPASLLTTLAQEINYTPPPTDGCIEVESFLGVQDSTNDQRDQFFVSFYHSDGTFLAALVFDNTSDNGNILRWKGGLDGAVTEEDTGIPFIRGDQILGLVSLQILRAKIDLNNNTWSAWLDGIPLFSDETFADPTLGVLDLGSIAYEWELAGNAPAMAGDNWLLVADLLVERSPQQSSELHFDLTLSESGCACLRWQGDPGYTYQVEYSEDLASWLNDLPQSTFTPDTDSELEFVDNQLTTQRFYRLRRSQP